MPRHALTKEENGRGGRARGENMRQRRAALEDAAAEVLMGALERACNVYIEAMQAERLRRTEDGELTSLGPAHVTRIKAADQVFNRVLGRATQRTELTGAIDLNVELGEARERLAAKLADQAARHRAGKAAR